MVINNRPVPITYSASLARGAISRAQWLAKLDIQGKHSGTWCIILELFARKTFNASLLPWELNRVSCSRMLT